MLSVLMMAIIDGDGIMDDGDQLAGKKKLPFQMFKQMEDFMHDTEHL